MRVPIPGAGTFSPSRPSSVKGVDEKILGLLRWELDPAVEEFCRAVRDLEVSDLSANRTGRRVVVRARAFGRSVRLTVAPYEGRPPGPRTAASVADELVQALSSRKLAGSRLLRERPLMDAVGDALRPRLDRGQYAGPAVILTVLRGEVMHRLASALDRAGPGRLRDAVNEFVSAGRHLGNFDGHQRKKAVESFREMACHAFRHGAKFDDLVTALREEMVRATMEA